MSTALVAARAKTKGKRMLRDALEAYGEDEYTLSEWNALKKQAERDGKWRWKSSDTSATLVTLKGRVEKDAKHEDLEKRFVTDLNAIMAAELNILGESNGSSGPNESSLAQCAWRERIGGKLYNCTNELHHAKTKAGTSGTLSSIIRDESQPSVEKRMCKWHARECVCIEHPMERSKAIDTPNDQGYCLNCYEVTALKERGTLQKTPPRIPANKIPGVCEVSLKRDVQRDTILRGKSKLKQNDGLSRHLTAKSRCAWEKEHSESAYIWQCRNSVVMHPTLRGAFLPFCGYHAPRCIHEYGASRKNGTPCPPIDRRNPFGMCRNHVESHLSTVSFEVRGKCIFADSEFDVPGLLECRRDRLNRNPKRHPLAPKTPPPQDETSTVGLSVDRFVVVKSPSSSFRRKDIVYRRLTASSEQLVATFTRMMGSTITTVLNHPNPLSGLLKDAIWRFQFLRRGAVVATRIQRIFRGNRARRRVRGMIFEQAAVRRIGACLKIQRIARGYLGRISFAREFEAVQAAVPTIQRVVRGGLARKRSRCLRATLCIQRNFRAYRQRCFLWSMREEIDYMRALQRQADANYEEMLAQVEVFRRLRARRVLRSYVAKWRRRKEEQARLAYERLQSLLSAIKIQRAFRRYLYYKRLKHRYISAQRIQKRVRGWLTRHMWKDDPGLLWITSFINPVSSFEYGKVVVLAQPSRSYSFPSRKVRMQFAALAIQRVHRGFMGRLAANMRWVAMLKRWEWLSMDSGGDSSDSMTLGHQRYGFLLPSHKYHVDRNRHMLEIKRGIKADRGFAYKYQNILELIQDRDGKRAWSLAREAKWKRDQETAKPQKKTPPERERAKERGKCQRELIAEKSIAIAEATFPVGCVVLVASTNRRDAQRFHKAKVVAVRTDPTKTTNASTADVQYIVSVLSVRGVRVYHESRVPLARLRHCGRRHNEAEVNRGQPRSVGTLIQSSIDLLKTEIQASASKRYSPPVSQLNEGALDDVDAIVDRLRDEDPHTDLLLDQRDFVNFVFINSTLLRTKWLQVVDHIRFGTRDKEFPTEKIVSRRHGSDKPLTPSLLAFYQEFGFGDVCSEKNIVPRPTRAKDIEDRMSQLGFLHEPSANVKDEYNSARKSKGARPRTTPHPDSSVDQITIDIVGKNKIANGSKDDCSEGRDAASFSSSAQNLHELIYELKTLPRERHREKIIEVTTRNARSFICGYPACGRCFSSHEAARLHQEGVHLHQRRLAIATPLVDQYMHAYWPPTSPWNQEYNRAFTPSVGYFHCSHADCRSVDGQFRTRRELERHMLQKHSIASGSNQTEPSHPASISTSQSPPGECVSALIWLGTYSVCRSNLERRIEGFPRSAIWHGSTSVVCELHRLTKPDPERCRECFLHTRRIMLPCRLYRTVALPGAHSQQHTKIIEQASTMDGYVIFSVEDQLLCPVVREQDIVALDEDEKDRQKRLTRHYAKRKVKYHDGGGLSPLVYLRLQMLCRDANGAGWAIGHVFRSQDDATLKKVLLSRSESTAKGTEPDGYEVTLDESHIVAVLLEDIRAVCIVHRCSSSVFQRKPFRRDDQHELRRLSEPRRAKTGDNTNVHRLRIIVERYWQVDEHE